MSIIVLAIGLVIVVTGLAVLIKPARLKDLLYTLLEKDWFRIVAALRVIIGVLFLFAAGGTRSPIFVSVMGVLFILAGVLIPILGSARLRYLASWWMERRDSVLRLWALVALALGGVLVWVVL
jgi:uncharacterized protein YjeT (DUF2065 family)